MSKRLKPVLTLALLIVIPITILILISLLIAPSTGSTGTTLPTFQTLAPGTRVQVADYQLAYSKNSLILTNPLTSASATLVTDYPSSAVTPAYMLFRLNSHPYLITRLGSGGSSGAYRFRVLRLDQDQAQDLTDPGSNPNLGLSCSNPRLNGAALVFEISLKCSAGAAVQDSSYQSYTIPLQ